MGGDLNGFVSCSIQASYVQKKKKKKKKKISYIYVSDCRVVCFPVYEIRETCLRMYHFFFIVFNQNELLNCNYTTFIVKN